MHRGLHGALRLAIVLSVTVVSTIIGEQGRSETILIPPLARAVELDGRVTPEEWADAATLTILHTLEGRDVESTFHFKYDEKTLWAAAVCPEPDRQRPVFQNPALEVNAALEDSVQVVLGLPGGEQERIDFGGYEDAAGQDLQPVARFMQYIVNSGGNRTQALNEMRLSRTDFEAGVWRGEGQWSVEWRIPLVALGLESPTNNLVYFNFLRIRTPQVTGLSPTNFGSSFGAFTFGHAFFLSQAEAARRTLQQLSTESRNEASRRPARELELDFYPIAGEVAATLTAGKEPAEPQTLQLHVDGVGKKEAPVQAGQVRVAVPIRNPGEWPEPRTVFSAKARLLDQAGAEIVGTARSEQFEMLARPAWAESDAGAEYVRDKVPHPWSVPQNRGVRPRLFVWWRRSQDDEPTLSVLTDSATAIVSSEKPAGPVRAVHERGSNAPADWNSRGPTHNPRVFASGPFYVSSSPRFRRMPKWPMLSWHCPGSGSVAARGPGRWSSAPSRGAPCGIRWW